ncbi:MAG: prephenate dehydrogenase [Phycisphaerales bacterium]|nr:prephenate dehydrogenase [Phycisphaerales bacterium]
MTQVREPIGVVGFGHFGRALVSLLDTAGMSYRAYDPHVLPGQLPHADATMQDLLRRARTIICCVPVRSLEGVLRAARPCLTREHLVLDVGSVKVLPTRQMSRELGAGVAWCATHPLFGPASLARKERPLRAVICPNTQHPAAADEARSLYERIGCEVIDQTPEEHDQLMAMTHALAFFVAKGMIGVGAGEDAAFVPPSFRAMKQTVDTVRVDAGHLFSVIQNDNPFAAAARRKLIDELEAIDADLRRAEGGTIKDLEIH